MSPFLTTSPIRGDLSCGVSVLLMVSMCSWQPWVVVGSCLCVWRHPDGGTPVPMLVHVGTTQIDEP